MTLDPDSPLASTDLPEIVRKIRARTPARLLAGRAGAAYRTKTQLELREAQAAARDAVRDELDLAKTFRLDFVTQWRLLEVCTNAKNKEEYLLRPGLGRHFDEASRALIKERCPSGADLQIAIGDGLSVAAVAVQVPPLLPLLQDGAKRLGWNVGQTFVIHHCRVGVLNEIGELLDAKVVVLLIGERPGLATAESLSAYIAYRPRVAHTDANRNLISNIHAHGLSPSVAAKRILAFAAQMMRAQVSGSTLREELPSLAESSNQSTPA